MPLSLTIEQQIELAQVRLGPCPDDCMRFIGKSTVDPSTLDVVVIQKGRWDILDYLTKAILRYNKGPVVEIGMGESTTILAKHAEKADVTLYSCDIEMGGMFKVFDKPLYSKHECFIGKSEDFIKQFDDEPAVVFIDGQHDYDVVKPEVDFFLDKLRARGVLFMHDTFPENERQTIGDSAGRRPGDVYKIRQELERNPEYDVFTWPYSAIDMGLTMVMKHWPNVSRQPWRQNGRYVVSQ